MTDLPKPADTPSQTNSRSAQIALSLFLMFLFGLLVYRAIGPRYQARPTEHHSATVTRLVNLNTADRGELLQIPGVGPSLADAILTHRNERGHFDSVEELAEVKGVKGKTLEKLRPWVHVKEPATPTEVEIVPQLEKLERKSDSQPKFTQAVRTGKIQAGEPPINVNTASESELQRLPGIGKELARRIVEYRKMTMFQSPDDLRQVKGIGSLTMESIRPFVVVK